MVIEVTDDLALLDFLAAFTAAFEVALDAAMASTRFCFALAFSTMRFFLTRHRSADAAAAATSAAWRSRRCWSFSSSLGLTGPERLTALKIVWSVLLRAFSVGGDFECADGCVADDCRGGDASSTALSSSRRLLSGASSVAMVISSSCELACCSIW